MPTPIELRDHKLEVAVKALKEAKFAIDSAIMLQGLTALSPYAQSVGAALQFITGEKD